MKKYFSLLILVVLTFVFALTGCSKEEEEGIEIDVSFINKAETKLITEKHLISVKSVDEQITDVLRILSGTPDSKEAKAPISGGINVVSAVSNDSQATVYLSEKYKELSNSTEVLTRAAIVKSLTQIPGIDVVMIMVDNEPIRDAMGNEIGLLSKESFVDNPGEQMDEYEKFHLKLYYANKTGDKLVLVDQEIVLNINTTNDSREKLVIAQLIAGSRNPDAPYYPTINASTKILGVTVKDGICYVNLDSNFVNPVNQETSDITIYSITNSLVELPNINKVQISIDGKTDVVFRDKYNLTTLFERNLDYVDIVEYSEKTENN